MHALLRHKVAGGAVIVLLISVTARSLERQDTVLCGLGCPSILKTLIYTVISLHYGSKVAHDTRYYTNTTIHYTLNTIIYTWYTALFTIDNGMLYI